MNHFEVNEEVVGKKRFYKIQIFYFLKHSKCFMKLLKVNFNFFIHTIRVRPSLADIE